MNQRVVRWTIFFVMAFTVPVIYFLFQIAATIPLAAIIAVGMWHVKSETGFLIMSLIHTAIYAPLLWWLSRYLTQFVFRAVSRQGQLCRLGATVAIFCALGFFAPYFIGGHGKTQRYSWAQAFRLE